MTSVPKLSFIKFQVADQIASISVNRPEQLNAVNPVVVHQFQQAVDHAIADSLVQGIVLGGEGKAFVVGADLDFFIRSIEASDIARITKFTQSGQRLLNTIANSPKPIIAQVHGVALGAGTEIALACHQIIATPNASFGLPETGLGIYPAFGGTQRTPRKVGGGLAKWLIYTGKTISASDAVKIGLIDAIVSPDDFAVTCRAAALGRFRNTAIQPKPPEFAALDRFFAINRADDLRSGTANTAGDPALARAMKSVANKALLALRVAEKLIEASAIHSLDEGLQMEVDHLVEIYTSEDARLGLTFRAKGQLGQPQFCGR